MRIVIVKFGALGDVIRTSYILKPIYEKYDHPDIWWLTSETSFDLLRYNPYINTIVTPTHNFELLKLTDFDLIISLDDEFFILDIVRKLKSTRVIGATLLENNSPVYCDKSAGWFDMGLISKYGKAFADKLKKQNTREHNEILADMLHISIDRPSFYNSIIIEDKVRGQFNKNYFCIGLNSGSGARWTSKQLCIDQTIALARNLLSMPICGKPVKVYLLGGVDEIERHRIIREAICSSHIHDTGHDNSLLRFAAIIKNCDYVITSDSLALHLSISQRVRNLSFYAPTSAAEIGTFGTGCKVISQSSDYCSYLKNADTSSITAERLLDSLIAHVNVC